MPKIKISKSSPYLDMTPMVDLAFLLVTFFMLTTQFRAKEPVEVNVPAAISEKILPENILLLTIDTEGKVFFTISGNAVRYNLLEKIGRKYDLTFSEEEKKRFSVMTSFGVPIQELKTYVALSENERNQYKSSGIPLDSLDNQLGQWVSLARIQYAIEAKKQETSAKDQKNNYDYKPLRFAIRADAKAPYSAVKKAMKVLTDLEIYRFNLVTNLSEKPHEE